MEIGILNLGSERGIWLFEANTWQTASKTELVCMGLLGMEDPDHFRERHPEIQPR
jgi:hypothetical protein